VSRLTLMKAGLFDTGSVHSFQYQVFIIYIDYQVRMLSAFCCVLIGFKLVKPFELLDAWAEHYHYRKNDVKEYYSILSVSEVEEKLMAYSSISGDRTGLTGFSGGARIAPAVRYQRVMAYAENIEEFVDSLGLKQVNSGANVHILGPYDEGVFYGSRYVGSDLIVSPIQIYLDLMSISGRGEEAAEAIMEQVIKSIW